MAQEYSRIGRGLTPRWGRRRGAVENRSDEIAASKDARDDSATAVAGGPDDAAGAEPEQGRGADGAILGATAGDESERCARMMLPHLAEAYTLARWITGDRIDAEDVVQEAFLRAFRGGALASDGQARTTVLAAVRKAAFAWLRDFHPPALVSPDEFGPSDHAQMRSWDADGYSPEAALIAKTDVATLEAAIAKLPLPFREALVMRDILGLSYREIAERTGVPIGTVMSRLARGRNRVIKAIGKALAREGR
jgi:RNA polymerase sigma-70 factor (ECF subfamily)